MVGLFEEKKGKKREDIQMTKRYIKKFSASLIIRKMQVKTITRHHLKPLKLDHILKMKINIISERGGQNEALCMTDWTMN